VAPALSFRDVVELLLQRGFEVTHETVRAWEFRFAARLADLWDAITPSAPG